MVTLRDAAQQALAALESVVEYDYHGNPLTETDAACNDAINELLSALANPVQPDGVVE